MSIKGLGIQGVWPPGGSTEETNTCSACGTVYLSALHYCPTCPELSPGGETKSKGKKEKKGGLLFVRMPKKGVS